MKVSKREGSGAVRLSIPAKVAYNADAFKKSIYTMLEELGCPKCFSGVDCYLTTIQDYVFDPRENLIRAAAYGDPNPQPNAMSAARTLSVGISPKTSFDIDKIDVALNDIFKDIGCLACCSGNDIFFRNRFDFNF